MCKAYELNSDIQSFAVANDFVINTNKACYELGKTLRPFCIFANEKQKEYNVIDFATFTGFADASKNLVDEIANIRREQYKVTGVYLSQDVDKKVLFFDYLLSISACYIEIPKYVTKEGMAQEAYDKFLMTKNPNIIAAWLGIKPLEAQTKYSGKIHMTGYDFDNGYIRCVKLMQSAKGNSITVPRSPLSMEKLSCIPLYMLWAFVEGSKTIMQDKLIEFGYLKDNGTVRVLPTTLNESIMRDYYKDNLFVNLMLNGIDINKVQQGGMMLSSHINRGYIKVPEIGISKYDATGVRSLNIARLLYAKEVTEVDRSYIDVDLDSVQLGFINASDSLLTRDESQVILMFKELTQKEPTADTPALIIEEAKKYVQNMITIFSTTYKKSLHTFMISHPQWFPKYTGVKIEDAGNLLSQPVAVGVGMFDF